ncbi:IclR family transcriptional regulator [Pararoseomonas indoligenes]|uniref:Helix-turn-helix domain-containing protein n=1 Tax=Roseomonas indoligenes TaxID=2820811 RepID=A0A940N0S4_9PROT|nr:IclR family transcriptional regulator C-terminal domain-containing protein [Pararoseomonas indoligenes]MBP0494595.1 helix-turn-helix domain-containing protein [Pararoseomonas indoligenes]
MGKRDEGEAVVDDRYIVPGLQRGLEVMLAFTPERRRMTLTEMGQAVGVTRSAVFRIAYTLDQLGFLTYDPGTRTYALGPQVLRLGYGYLASRDLLEVARPQLEGLRDRTGWSAHLGVLEEREVVYLARLPTRRSLSSVVQVGTRLPAHATSMGRVLLSALSVTELRDLYAGIALEPHGPRTPTTIPALLAQAEADRAAGFAAHVAGYEAGVASVAAPVRDVAGATVAAINISTIALLTSEEELRGPLAREVVATAARISAALGSRPADARA